MRASDRTALLAVSAAALLLLLLPALLLSLLHHRRYLRTLHILATIVFSVFLLARFILSPDAGAVGRWPVPWDWGSCRMDVISTAALFTVWHVTLFYAAIGAVGLHAVFRGSASLSAAAPIAVDEPSNNSTLAPPNMHFSRSRSPSVGLGTGKTYNNSNGFAPAPRTPAHIFLILVTVHLLIALTASVVPAAVLFCPESTPILILPDASDFSALLSLPLDAMVPPTTRVRVQRIASGGAWPVSVRSVAVPEPGVPAMARSLVSPAGVAFHAVFIVHVLALWPIVLGRLKKHGHSDVKRIVTRLRRIWIALALSTIALVIGVILLAVDTSQLAAYFALISSDYPGGWIVYADYRDTMEARYLAIAGTILVSIAYLFGMCCVTEGVWGVFASWTQFKRLVTHRTHSVVVSASSGATANLKPASASSATDSRQTVKTSQSALDRASFRRCLRDPAGFSHFIEYCMKRHCSEYPLFYLQAKTLGHRRRYAQRCEDVVSDDDSLTPFSDSDPEDNEQQGAMPPRPSASSRIAYDDYHRAIVQRIYETFLAPGATMELNMEQSTLNHVRRAWPPAKECDGEWTCIPDPVVHRRSRVITGPVLRDVRQSLFIGVWPGYVRENQRHGGA